MTHDPRPNEENLDPDQAITAEDYEDPTPEPVGPDHPDYVEPGQDYTHEVAP